MRRLGGTLVVAAISCGLLMLGRGWQRSSLEARAPQSSALRANGGELLRLTLAADGQYRLWVPLEQMPERLPQAVLLYEDRWFYWHPGVNPVALMRAAVNNWRGGRRLGASTLTMQLARRIYRLDTRHPLGKLRQILDAMWLETRYRKRDILEAYLNLAPYGGNIEGVGAASLVYFGKPVGELSVPQLMTLSVIPQNPRRRGLADGDRSDPSPLGAARRRLWTRWIDSHPEDRRFADADAASPAPRALPFLAPHFTDAVLRRTSGVVTTTLELSKQTTVERVLAHFVAEQSDIGIRNAGALLLELNQEGSAMVRAYVGSAGYHDPDIDGQVNAVMAKRSPGSTLKPFVYALAIDQGLLHPRTILKDTPSSFGPFSPENFDGRFVGPIAAEDALVRSRNVPAVAVASRLARPDLYDFLTAAGVSRLNSERYYGLALTLGGGEVSMEELGRMYAILPNGGRLPTLTYLAAGDPIAAGGSAAPDSHIAARPAPTRYGASGSRLLSEEASFITLDMLAKNPRPDTGQPAVPAVAWKTGTSWGFHDAWSAAVFGRHVLVVWIGNFDNTGNPAFVGVQAAAPLMFRIIDALRSQGLDPGGLGRPAPRNLARIRVCAASGDLPNADCPQTVETWYIPGTSPIKISQLHRRVYLDAAGRRVCGPGPGTHEEVYEFWSSDMLRLFREAGMPRRMPPAAPDCGAAAPVAAAVAAPADREAPQIVSPLKGVIYSLRIGSPQPIALRANLSPEARTAHWFAGNAYLGRTDHGAGLAWQPSQPGRYVLRVVDDQGASDAREIDVDFVP